jgi:anti-sigma factor RsiW
MSDQWTNRLSEYLDGELAGSERALLEAHLERCVSCQETLADLRRVVLRARSLEERPPAADLWAGVARRIGAPPRLAAASSRRRFTFSLPQLLAAGIALAVFSASGAWMLHPSLRTVAVQPAPPAPGDLSVTSR